ncbi:MAG: type II/IV secretion system ATPase subunit, partial [Euryarchaeota archaeon]|nr:type II/IV secretion system ATPase subunit [Euryarchaeota archaeon]
MATKIAICPGCHTKINCEGAPGQKVKISCPGCKKAGTIVFSSEMTELDFYPLNEPYAYAKILKNNDTLEKYYKLMEPQLSEDEQKALNFIWETLMKSLNIRLDELESKKIEEYLTEKVEQVISGYEIKIDTVSKKKIMYYIKRESLGMGKIDALMRDPHLEDVSCDGANVPLFLYHRKYGSVRSSVKFKDEEELSYFVVRLAQKCGKHISIAEPMLDATMPDGSRIQMTLSTEVTAKGSTFTIRKFRADPFTPPDLIDLNTMSTEILAYFWLAVENRVNALIAGGTASGKTTILNALSLFIPREAKIVSIEETREINLPHPNWIPGVARSGFGEIVQDRMVGEIDMYDLMKAALRQRPEYI